MKKILPVLFILLVLGAKAQHIVDTSTFTKYRPGFTYYYQGLKITLLKWTKVGTSLGYDYYRWEARYERGGISVVGWIDDWFIDRSIKKGSY